MRTGRENKPRILMIGIVAPPLGGMATSLGNLVNSDLKGKYEFLVLDITGFRTRRNGNLITGIFYQIYLLLKLVYWLASKNTPIVHVHMTSFFYLYRRSVDMLICKIFCKKIVVHVRGSRFLEFYKESSAAGKFIIRSTLGLSDRIIALSGYWFKFLSEISSAKKISVIPNGVKCSDFRLRKNKKNELGFTDKQIFILFAGVIGKRKGAFDILSAIPKVTSQIKEVTFIFLGPEEYKGELQLFDRTIRAKGIESNVYYMGAISGQDKFDYYMSSDIFILPSYAENLPNSVLEAMAAALPVVTSDVGAIPEVIEDGVNGFIVKPGDINSIAEKIIKLAKDGKLRKSMGKRNLGLAKEKYDMPIIARKIDGLYQELLK